MIFSPIAETTSNRWGFSDGSGVRLIPQRSDRFVSLIVEVKSLDRAQAFLATHDMIGHENESSITIVPSSLAGLNIQLVESVRDYIVMISRVLQCCYFGNTGGARM